MDQIFLEFLVFHHIIMEDFEDFQTVFGISCSSSFLTAILSLYRLQLFLLFASVLATALTLPSTNPDIAEISPDFTSLQRMEGLTESQ